MSNGRGRVQRGASEFLFGQPFDVHVTERHDAHLGNEPRRAVHVPHPGVAYLEFDAGRRRVGAHFQRDLVGQIEPAFGLNDVGEDRQDGSVLLDEPELNLGFVAFEVFLAHAATALRVRILLESLIDLGVIAFDLVDDIDVDVVGRVHDVDLLELI
jgi:hypothetical protein